MAPLFSKADLKKFWHDVQNEVTLILPNLVKIYSVFLKLGRKTKWPPVFGLSCMQAS